MPVISGRLRATPSRLSRAFAMTDRRWDSLWINIRLATMDSTGAAYGAIDDGALAVVGNRIAWVGARADLPGLPATCAAHVHDGGGRWVTPGLIDCHTHIVYGGDRAKEFELRLQGASYEEISRAGGGIVATVTATRLAAEQSLYDQSLPRVCALLREGVTTLEIKSGYGLNTENELKILRVARRLGQALPVDVVTTFLGAHAVPIEFAGRPDAYIDTVCTEMIPAAAALGLADAVDAFCERIAFTPEQTERVFQAARRHGLAVKLHAEQLSNRNGTALAVRYGALSCDHLEYVDEADVGAMAEGGTVAVLLPGAFYFLRETKRPPIDWFRRHGVAMALATDCNPGSSPVTSLLLMLNMACTLFHLTPEEALAGVTRHAAAALGLAHDRGTLTVGKRADFVLWSIGQPAELAYRIAFNPLARSVRAGHPIDLAMLETGPR